MAYMRLLQEKIKKERQNFTNVRGVGGISLTGWKRFNESVGILIETVKIATKKLTSQNREQSGCLNWVKSVIKDCN